jgi:hypothetical protein
MNAVRETVRSRAVHAGAETQVGVEDYRVTGVVPGEAEVDAESSALSDVVVEDKGWEKEMGSNRGFASTNGIKNTTPSIRDVSLCISGVGRFEYDSSDESGVSRKFHLPFRHHA